MSLKTPTITEEQAKKLGTEKIYMRIYNSIVVRVEAESQEEADQLLDAKIEKYKKQLNQSNLDPQAEDITLELNKSEIEN